MIRIGFDGYLSAAAAEATDAKAAQSANTASCTLLRSGMANSKRDTAS